MEFYFIRQKSKKKKKRILEVTIIYILVYLPDFFYVYICDF